MHPLLSCMYKQHADIERRLAPKRRYDGDEASRSAVKVREARPTQRACPAPFSLLHAKGVRVGAAVAYSHAFSSLSTYRVALERSEHSRSLDAVCRAALE